MSEYSAYIGLDVHKDTIAVAVALPGRGEPVYRGELAHRRGSLRRLIGRLSPHGEVLSFCYEAGPCGYGVYREITEAGHDCAVVAPSLIPRKPGDRVKTDRRDALMLARLHRSGDLTPVWVPGQEQEAVRDLTRAREDMKAIELKARQRLGAFFTASRSGVRGALPVDAGAFSVVGDAAIRAPGAAGGVSGVRGHDRAGHRAGGVVGGADARGAGEFGRWRRWRRV